MDFEGVSIMEEKKMIKINTGYDLNLRDIFNNTNVEQACHNIRKFAEQAVKQIEPLMGKAEEIVFDVYGGYEYDEISISYRRLETDEEFNSRVLRKEKSRLKKEKCEMEKLEKERKEYERLKQKFEKQ